MLLEYIKYYCSAEITKEFDKVWLISATANDIYDFSCIRDYQVINLRINVKLNRSSLFNKLIQNATAHLDAIASLTDAKHIIYDTELTKIDDKKNIRYWICNWTIE